MGPKLKPTAGWAVVVILGIVCLMFLIPVVSLASPSATPDERNISQVNLKLKGYFPSKNPEEQGIIFSQPGSIATDNHGHIAILDLRENRVYLFSAEEKLISSFGRQGQGPGEFSFPIKIGFYKDLIYVFDSGSRRLQFFKGDGSFVRLIKLLKSYSDLTISDEGKIYCSLLMKTGQEPNLVDILDSNGNLLVSLGEPEKIAGINSSYINQIKVLPLGHGQVLLGFITTGLLSIYDETGKKLKDIPALRDYLEAEYSANLKNLTSLSQGKKIGYLHLFESVKAVGDKLYFLRSRPSRYEIIEMDNNFNLSRQYTYKFKAGLQNLSLDFALREDLATKNLEFFLLELSPENVGVIVLEP